MITLQKSTMPKAYLKKWLAALRSGEYKRGKNALYNGNASDPRFCCLGVLQHCLTGGVEFTKSGMPESLPSREWLAEYNIHFKELNNDEDVTVADVKMGDGRIASLADLNDNDITQYSFKKIANYIEKNFEGY